MMFGFARSAVLATNGDKGFPHLVPIVFGMVGEDTIVTAIDHKPKTTTNLVRLANIKNDPLVSVLVDDYSENWATLWWARADGTATVVDTVDDHVAASLVNRYQEYTVTAPKGPWIIIKVSRWTGWAADVNLLDIQDDSPAPRREK